MFFAGLIPIQYEYRIPTLAGGDDIPDVHQCSNHGRFPIDLHIPGHRLHPLGVIPFAHGKCHADHLGNNSRTQNTPTHKTHDQFSTFSIDMIIGVWRHDVILILATSLGQLIIALC